PSPADRIRCARMAAEPGIFHDDRPASALFASFEHPARFVTLLHYTDNLGIPITEDMLLRIESKQSEDARGYVKTINSSEEFFMGTLPILMPLRVRSPIPAADHEASLAELGQLTEGLRQV